MPQKAHNPMSRRHFGVPPIFDPTKGKTVKTPENKGYGWWVGGHSVIYDDRDEKFYLYYRVRQPLGRGRGGKCRIAESTDGHKFTDIWEATKEQLDAESIEVGSLIRDPYSGVWRFYISYQLHNGPWRIDLIEADSPKNLDPWHHRTVMQPEEYGVSFIKDPKVYNIGGMYAVFVAASAPQGWYEDDNEWRHPLGNDATALMLSADGIYFKNFKYIFRPGGGAPGDWGRFRARINSVVYLPPVYIGFFDGGTTMYDNYEEWAGVAFSHDLENWHRVSTLGPWVKSPHGCVRYIDALIVGDEIWYYYEYTREDKSHELRVSKVPL